MNEQEHDKQIDEEIAQGPLYTIGEGPIRYRVSVYYTTPEVAGETSLAAVDSMREALALIEDVKSGKIHMPSGRVARRFEIFKFEPATRVRHVPVEDYLYERP